MKTEIGPVSTVREILSTSQRRNTKNGLTGFLIFDKTNFLQVLEGDRGAVERTYSKIARDTRHDDLKIIEQREVAGRSFAEWDMGGFIRSPEVQHIYEQNGLQDPTNLQNADAGKVLALALQVAAFEGSRKNQRTIDR